MQGMLLGMLQDIIKGVGTAISNVLESMLKPLLKIVFKWVVTPILKLLLHVLSYMVGAVCYTISCFILQLIDFVELLFRTLAGLESTSATGMSMDLSLDGGSGDILIQLIRHPDIQSAFVSMCVVGLFLLVVTTVFQIIKVEYTTEGAKNAKGPIFQKAFKGLANLMLLPLLVVFGIVFANQLLGLLDTATKGGGDNPTMSGLIFVSAASEAHYLKGEKKHKVTLESGDWIGVALVGIELAIEDFDKLIEEKTVNPETGELEYDNSDDEIEKIEDGFISQTTNHKYYDFSNVAKYYNYARINYILLLFGGIFVLKSLFFASFGMVIRLYKCAMLFIISPAIIGMTPINEGGLGKWRTSFIGQVLAAYGTILSLNLFFIIVRVLLSIEVKFSSKGGVSGIVSGALSSSFMTLLLKMMFVLAGCLLIEQFAKDIGGYFGAEDAMSAGKGMAGQVGDLAMKGVATAALVGTGGAALAMRGAKMAGGIAGKVGAVGKGFKQGVQSEAGGTFGQKLAGGLKGGLSVPGNAIKEQATKASMRFRSIGRGRADRKASKAADLSEFYGEKAAELEAKNASGTPLTLQEHRALNEFKTKRDKNYSKFSKAVDKSDKLKGKQSDKEWAEFDTERLEKKAERERKVLNATSMVYGLGMQGKDNLPGMKYFKQFSKATGEGSKALGDTFETAHKDAEYQKGKKVQDTVQNSALYSTLISHQTAAGSAKVMAQVGKELEGTMKTIKTTAEDVMERFLQLTSGTKKDEKQTNEYRNLEMQYLSQINATGSNLSIDTFRAHVEKAENSREARGANFGDKFTAADIKAAANFDLKTDLKLNFNPKDIQDAVDKALSKGALTPEAIRKELEGVFKNLGKEGEATLMHIIAKAIEKVAGQIGGK